MTKDTMHKALAQRQVFPGGFLVESVAAESALVRSAGAVWSVPYVSDGNGGFAFGKLERVKDTVETVTEQGVRLQRQADFTLDGRAESVTVAPARMVADAEHDPEKGDYHLIVVEAGTTPEKHRIITDGAIEGLPDQPYTGLKMYLDHDEPDRGKELGVRRVRDLAASVVKSWVVPAAESPTGKAQAHAVAHVFPNAAGFAESMRDPVFRGLIGVSHVVDYAGYIGKDDDGVNWQVVTEIPRRHGVDFVTEAGARGRAAESAETDKQETEMDWTKITSEDLAAKRPDLLQQIADGAVERFKTIARESDKSEEVEAKLADAERRAQEATAKLRGVEIAEAARTAVAAETGIPSAVRDDVTGRIVGQMAATPAEIAGEALRAEAVKLVKAEAGFIAKAAGKGPEAVVPASERTQSEAETGKSEVKRMLARAID